MRYIEFVYLAVAIGLLGFMISAHKDLQPMNYVGIIVGMLVATFMYAFRRGQRIAAERREAEEIAELEKEIEDGD